ncbi:superoxide dismutase [Babesia caballi]|uniref:Superoxide dismutase n=1 Tax=Babesia caballi TaxID=5871 RepID=A0AAV4LQC7_BABCB|nr:superoxide dismutase [Babesia caballi]
MKFRGEFKVENLHHFVGCLLSLSKLSCEHPDPLSAVIKITRQFVSVVAKTVLSSEAFLEIHTVSGAKSPYILEGREDDVITLNVSVNSLYETLNAAVNSEYAALKLKKYGWAVCMLTAGL